MGIERLQGSHNGQKIVEVTWQREAGSMENGWANEWRNEPPPD